MNIIKLNEENTDTTGDHSICKVTIPWSNCCATQYHVYLEEYEPDSEAIEILEDSLKGRDETVYASPAVVRKYLYLQLAGEPAEKFCCLFLDNRHRLIAFDVLFNGTLDGCSVHPREVVRAVMGHNAAAVILAHNHPSGVAEPSSADISLTKRLVDSLNLIEVRVLDHVVVGSTVEGCVSFAERGLI
jgi:DNA repair protein RadC